MTEAMPFLQKTILLSYDPRSLPPVSFFEGAPGRKSTARKIFGIFLAFFRKNGTIKKVLPES